MSLRTAGTEVDPEEGVLLQLVLLLARVELHLLLALLLAAVHDLLPGLPNNLNKRSGLDVGKGGWMDRW